MSYTTKKALNDKERELKLVGYKSLGYENGFYKDPPPIFSDCKHPKNGLSDGHGDHLRWCSECKFLYKVDSSD